MSKEFSNQRLIDSVSYVIDTCVYPTPTLANFLSFDKKIDLFTYDQMQKKVNDYGHEIWNIYKSIKIEGITMWAKEIDIEKYKL